MEKIPNKICKSLIENYNKILVTIVVNKVLFYKVSKSDSVLL